MRLLFAVALFLTLGCEIEVVPRGEDAGAPPDAGLEADAGLWNDGGSDGGVDSDAGLGADGGPGGPLLYPYDSRHSPITDEVAASLLRIADNGPTRNEDRFMKVGDSITVDPNFLHCFAGGNVDLDGRPIEETRAYFATSMIGADTSFDRSSVSAVVGWSAFAPLGGSPTYLDQEHSAVSPRYATLMFGSNDVGFRNLQTYARDMWTLIDILTSRGTIPLMSTIPPRDDMASVDARVPRFNQVIRALAQRWSLPLIDFHRELLALPGHGLSGDGVHPQVYASGGCRLTDAGLQHGYNVRNLITLEQLDRARRALDSGALDSDGPRLRGDGTVESPYLIESLPFAMHGDTRGGARRLDTYGCASQDESGPEVYYRLTLASPTQLNVGVVSTAGVDVDVHLLSGAPDASVCLARDDQDLTESVSAGTYFVVADTFVGSSGESPGEYLIYALAD